MLPQTNVNHANFNTTSLYTRPIFVNKISSPWL